jgi:zinc carboxypeptidase
MFELALAAALVAAPGPGRGDLPDPKVPLRFDRFYDYDEMTDALKRLVAAYPDFLTLSSIGKTWEGRDLWLVTIDNPKTGPDTSKPAFYLDGNIHGNEVQGSETALYAIWFLMENYGRNEMATRLVDERAFYVLPMVNADGRAHWFSTPNTSSSSRSGLKPVDDDGDGLFDEDPPDDLDGDGEILQMRKRDPYGRWKTSRDDPRLMVPCEPDEKGEFTMLGLEGIDNDGDGRINEDGPGGYDLNRNWPADWQPDYVQFGAGDYPFSFPEPRAIGAFLLAHPNVAGVQAFHNAGGMILRGPGAKEVGDYPGGDVAVYDVIGKRGESMLPFYRYMVIWKDLYTVHGGFVNWTYEGLGIFSFTNELWNGSQYQNKADEDATARRREEGGPGRLDDAGRRAQADRLKWDDLVELGARFVEWHPFHHPTYGDIEIGGWTKFSSRVPPTFMLEELCHRNAAFTLFHADQMPKPAIASVDVAKLDGGAYRVTATIANDRLIPTRSQMAAQKKIGTPDRLSIAGTGVEVLSGGVVEDRWFHRVRPAEREPMTLRLDGGVPGNGAVIAEWIVRGAGSVEIAFEAEKGGKVSKRVELR